MKKMLLVFLALLLNVTLTQAMAETVIIGDGGAYGALVGETIDADELLEMTVQNTTVVDSWGQFPADTRNKYLIIPVDILNISFGEADIGSSVSLKLAYRDYRFDTIAMRATDGEGRTSDLALLGNWTVNELISKSLSTTYQTTITKDDNGDYWLEWAKSNRKAKLNLYPENSYFTVGGNTDAYICYRGFIAGPQSIWVRDTVDASQKVAVGDPNTLSMLEGATFEYVLKLPNAVIDRLSDCYVEITVDEKDYTVHL